MKSLDIKSFLAGNTLRQENDVPRCQRGGHGSSTFSHVPDLVLWVSSMWSFLGWLLYNKTVP